MNEQKLRLLWKKFFALLANEDVNIDEIPEPNIAGVMVPGNRSDVIAYILMARLIDKLAWRASEGYGDKYLSHIALLEKAANIMPKAVGLTKEAKRGGLEIDGAPTVANYNTGMGEHKESSETLQK